MAARYAYECRCGKIFSRFHTWPKIAKTARCVCGKRARRTYTHVNAASSAAWPMLSDACGVHPSQVAEAEAHSIAHGVPTHFKEDGRAELTDRSHRSRYLKIIAMHDRNAGYSDPAPP